MVTGRITLVFIGHNQLVRCDVSSRGKARGVWSRPRAVGVELPGLVDAALRAGGRRPGDVYVLAADFWSQKITLSDDVTHGLSRDEVSRSLAFEAESLSGLTALDSEIGYCVTAVEGKNRDYWIVQVPSWVREQIDAAVRQTGGRLRGMAHPGGLPHAVTPTANGKRPTRWLRVEAWPGMVIGLGVGHDGRLQNSVMHADARGTTWRGSVETLRQSLGAIDQGEQLADAGVEPPLGQEYPALRLSEESAMAAWLPQWAGVLSRGSAAVPMLTPPKRPVSNIFRVAAAVLLAAGMAAACLWDHRTLSENIARTEAEIADCKAQTAATDAGKTQITALEKQITERRRIIERVEAEMIASKAVLASYTTRWPRLLDALSRLCPEHTTIRLIDVREGKLVIRGRSLYATAVDQLTSALATDLRGGWFVAPSEKRIAPATPEVGYCDFEIELVQWVPTKILPAAPFFPTSPEAVISQR